MFTLNHLSVRLLLYIGVFVFACYADAQVFKIGDVLDLRSRLLAARILGADYPESAADCHRSLQGCPLSVADASAVVLFDDRTLENFQTSWPAPYSAHALVLSRILKQRPRAVFVDILFVDKRPDFTIHRLTKVIKEYRQQNIPLIFAAPPRDMRKNLLPEIRQALGSEPDRSMASVVLATAQTGMDPATTRYPPDGSAPMPVTGKLAVLAEYATALAYPLPGSRIGCDMWPAAFQLARIYREGSDAMLKDCAPPTIERHEMIQLRATGVDRSSPRQFVQIRWKGKPGVGVEQLWRCDESDLFFQNQLLSRIERTYKAWTGDFTFEQTCPPIASVRAIELIKRDQETISASADCDRSIVDCLSGRVVFYGADIAGADDRVETPISGRIPGVYVHAMAFDNLLTFGLPKPENLEQFAHYEKYKKIIDFVLICIFCYLGIILSLYLKYELVIRNKIVKIAIKNKLNLGLYNLIIAVLFAIILSFIIAVFLVFLMNFLYLHWGLPPFNLLGLQIMVGTTILFDALAVERIFLFGNESR